MEKIMPVTKRVRIDRLGLDVDMYDLSVSYIDRVQHSPELDTVTEALLDASNMSAEQISSLRRSEAARLAEIVYELTLPESVPSGEESEPGKCASS